MQPDERESAYLWDMLDTARFIREMMASIPFYQYNRNRAMQWSVERGLEIIGEAARRVPDDFRERHPEIPWRRIIGQRNVIAHEYGEIKQEILWRLTQEHIPELIVLLEALDLTPPSSNCPTP